jgi:hypothetical protein
MNTTAPATKPTKLNAAMAQAELDRRAQATLKVDPPAPTPKPASPFKTAKTLDEVDALRLENLALKVQAASQQLQNLQSQHQQHVSDILTRYTGDGETIALQQDGRTIVRTKKASA